ncbi:MAG: methylenetetrahydrofolate reductase [Actinomycetaceae bacterium]|nr:methylenetetrahydrofolate reductase [Arcanobacterium sp.]MDD7687306.1 methylenetetrahydrofolate reductase [Actinomycetaceae bacterium]MDY5274075.1 methylenetetrahydrofolate reductase [Arcanobacterium sp.]
MTIADVTLHRIQPSAFDKIRHDLMLSFEVMPPRSQKAVEPFFDNLSQLLSVRPDFVSVTYGAGGKDRRNVRGLVKTLVEDSPTHPIAHLTTVGDTRDGIRAVVENYLDEGVRTFLALRGDPPADNPTWTPGPNDVRSASELITLIRLAEARRSARHSGLALRQALRPLTIAVATFVNGNPQAGTTREQEIENLAVKQEAGADMAITQLFWNPEAYSAFVDAARHEGVHIPIVPGVLPPVSYARLTRMSELTGVQAPPALLRLLANSDNPTETGIQIGAQLIQKLLEADAPGIHIYTANKAAPALGLLQAADLIRPHVRRSGDADLASDTSAPLTATPEHMSSAVPEHTPLTTSGTSVPAAEPHASIPAAEPTDICAPEPTDKEVLMTRR